MENKKRIKETYVTHLMEQGRPPKSIYQFMKVLGLEEKEFYAHFTSFMALEKELWAELFTDTLDMMRGEEVYADYSAREKLLSLYYSFFERLKNNRSFATLSLKRSRNPLQRRELLGLVRKSFVSYTNTLVSEGKEGGEIAERPYITEKYGELLWPQFVLVLEYWLKDDSKGFEKTDEAIEKAVNLSFDLMGRTALDSAVDLVKFLVQK